ncbi:MAG TPA: SRPBCC family protein [Acidimicrobiia bacterium]|nr:SRPBCC family protein [Acidimicrobiia bacterium]
MKLEVSTDIERPVGKVWDFYAVRHVENHARWDPSIELEPASHEPIGVGTVIRRRATRFGTIAEGTMEVTEFEPQKVMSVRTQDGPMAISGSAVFDALGEGETRLTLAAEFLGMDDSMEETIRPLMERSASNIKSLIESED